MVEWLLISTGLVKRILCCIDIAFTDEFSITFLVIPVEKKLIGNLVS